MSQLALEALIMLAAKYGPGLALEIADLFEKDEITVAEVKVIFGKVRPYESFGIPEVVPKKP